MIFCMLEVMKKLMGDEGWGGALFFSTDPKCLCRRRSKFFRGGGGGGGKGPIAYFLLKPK